MPYSFKGDTVAGKAENDRSAGATTRSGFTVMELIIVLLIGGMLAALAAPPITTYWKSRQMIQARDAFIRTAAEARASAIEEGDLVVMNVYPAKDSVVLTQRDGTMIWALDLQSDALRTDLVGSELSICYMPRGYAHPTCLDGADLPVSVGFTSGSDTVWAEITLGQVERQ